MPYCHIFIEINANEPEEYDLSREECELLVESYHVNKKLMFDGSIAQPSEIESFQIYETQEDVETFVEAKRRHFSVLKPDFLIVGKYGKNVSNLFIKHPPKERVKEKALRKQERNLN